MKQRLNIYFQEPAQNNLYLIIYTNPLKYYNKIFIGIELEEIIPSSITIEKKYFKDAVKCI